MPGRRQAGTLKRCQPPISVKETDGQVLLKPNAVLSSDSGKEVNGRMVAAHDDVLAVIHHGAVAGSRKERARPPRWGFCSSKRTPRPSSASATPAARPEKPPPMIKTSSGMRAGIRIQESEARSPKEVGSTQSSMGRKKKARWRKNKSYSHGLRPA